MGVRIDQGRQAFVQQRWGEAFVELAAADGQDGIGPEDLERLAVAAYLVGRDHDWDDALTRAHQGYLQMGDAGRAARCAFWLGLGLLLRGEMARSGGWLARARRLADEHQLDDVEQGYLLIPVALQHLDEGDAAAALDASERAADLGTRWADPDLTVMATLGRGQALARLGDFTGAVALLDEVMVAVTAAEVSPIVVGIVYCAVILTCREMFDLRRAQEWTLVLARWCDTQPDLVPFRGQCLVHRSELLQRRGAWPAALDEVRAAMDRLAGHPAVGMAHYQEAELHRLRGELTAAADAYRQASERGRTPQPGLALLRLAEGDIASARVTICRVLDETEDRLARAELLAASVDIMLAAGDLPTARVTVDELTAIAGDLGVPLLEAVAAHASGAVLLAEGEARGACAVLRRASAAWRQLESPYETARTRVLLGRALEALADWDSAGMELDAARSTFQELGAVPALRELEAWPPPARTLPGGLTGREMEVLALVARGRTNREIASALVISEHTVARHLQNIYRKLGVSSRTAAGAYAFEHGLL